MLKVSTRRTTKSTVRCCEFASELLHKSTRPAAKIKYACMYFSEFRTWARETKFFRNLEHRSGQKKSGKGREIVVVTHNATKGKHVFERKNGSAPGWKLGLFISCGALSPGAADQTDCGNQLSVPLYLPTSKQSINTAKRKLTAGAVTESY